MTLTQTLSQTVTAADSTYVRAPEYVVTVVGHKPVAVVTVECVVCGWQGYETCHGDTLAAHTAHVVSLHTCPEPGLIVAGQS